MKRLNCLLIPIRNPSIMNKLESYVSLHFTFIPDHNEEYSGTSLKNGIIKPWIVFRKFLNSRNSRNLQTSKATGKMSEMNENLWWIHEHELEKSTQKCQSWEVRQRELTRRWRLRNRGWSHKGLKWNHLSSWTSVHQRDKSKWILNFKHFFEFYCVDISFKFFRRCKVPTWIIFSQNIQQRQHSEPLTSSIKISGWEHWRSWWTVAICARRIYFINYTLAIMNEL